MALFCALTRSPDSRRETHQGAHALNAALRDVIDLGIFVDAPEEFMRRRRRHRDETLGLTSEHWHGRWHEHYAAYRTFILPQREHADLLAKVLLDRTDGRLTTILLRDLRKPLPIALGNLAYVRDVLPLQPA